MQFDFRRIIALLLLAVTISGLVVSLGEEVLCAGELPGVHETRLSSIASDTTLIHGGDCPCVPSQPNHHNDHFCAGDCGCPCHAPLSSPVVTTSYSPSFDKLSHFEYSPHIPEVYLDRFIPPQNLA